MASFQIDCHFLADGKVFGCRIRSTSDFLREARQNKIERRWSFQIQKLSEFSSLSDCQTQAMRHIFQRFIDTIFFLQLILDIIQQLQLIQYPQQLIFVEVGDIEIFFLDVLHDFCVDLGSFEIGQHFLSDVHYEIQELLQMEFKNIFTKKEEQEELSCFPNLSFTERLIGFGICCALGFVLEILSFGAILSIATGNPAKFALIYSMGNILTLAATGFLIGFKRQIKNMVHMDRRVATIIFVGALVGTLISALVFQSKILVLICLLIQIPAYIWYCASYIPFAQNCIKSCLKSCLGRASKEANR